MAYGPACDFLDWPSNTHCQGNASYQIAHLTASGVLYAACRRHALAALFHARFNNQLRILPRPGVPQ